MTAERVLRLSLARDMMWVFLGQFAVAAASLVGLRMITGVVSPSTYGRVVLSIGAVALAQGLVSSPISQAVLRFHGQSEGPEDTAGLRSAAIRALRWPFTITAVILFSGVFIWTQWTHDSPLLAATCVGLYVVDSLRVLEVAFLNADRRQRVMSVVVAADAWGRAMAGLAAVLLLGASPGAVVLGYLSGSAVVLGAYYLMCPAVRSAWWRALRGDASEGSAGSNLWRYAKPLIPLPIVGWVSGQADRYILGGLTGLVNTGAYSAVYALASKPFMMLSGGLELAIRPAYYRRVNQRDGKGERQMLLVWLACLLVVGGTGVGLLQLLHVQLAGLLLGSEYREYSALMVPIGVGYLLLGVSQMLTRVCYAWHDTKGVLGVEVVGSAASVLIAVPMVWTYGITGAAWAVPMYFGVQMILAAFRARGARLRGPASASVEQWVSA